MDLPERLAALQRANDNHLQCDAIRRVASLTTRERELLKGILAGHSEAALAAQLGCSAIEAEHFISVLRAKLGAKTNADAVRIGIYAGLE